MSLQAEIRRIVAEAERRRIAVKLVGAWGVKHHSPRHARETFDVDVVALGKDEERLVSMFRELGFRHSRFTRRRVDLVFFRKEPLRMKVDVNLDVIRSFERPELFLDVREELTDFPGQSLSPESLFLSKLFGPIDEDVEYDLACLILDSSPSIDKLVGMLNENLMLRREVDRKLPSLTGLTLKELRFRKGEKENVIRFIRSLRRRLKGL
ncbi:MAG: nucleotidyltransferase domain-containing protein [Candidatus Bathyarchaeia archaeon]